MFPHRSAAGEIEQIDPRWLVDTAVLHIPAYGLLTRTARAAITDAAATVRAAGGIVTVDLSAITVIQHVGPVELCELLEELQPRVVFANVDEAEALGLAPRSTARSTARWTTLIKDGRRPARIVRPDGSVSEVPAEPVAHVRDTTGAGDAFAGAVLVALQRGEPLEQACVAGHAAAANVLGTLGATGTG